MSKEAVTGAVQEAATIRILQKMVQTNTVNPPGNEKQLAQWIADELARAGRERARTFPWAARAAAHTEVAHALTGGAV